MSRYLLAVALVAALATPAAAQDEPGMERLAPLPPLPPSSQPLPPSSQPVVPPAEPGPQVTDIDPGAAPSAPLPTHTVVAAASRRWLRGYGVVGLAIGLYGTGEMSAELMGNSENLGFDTKVQPGFYAAGYYVPLDFIHLGAYVALLKGDVSVSVDFGYETVTGTSSTTTFSAGASVKLGGAVGPLWLGFATDIGVATWTAEEGNSFVGLALFPRLVVDAKLVDSRGFKMGLSSALGAFVVPTASTSQEYRQGFYPSEYVEMKVWQVQLALMVGLLFGG